MSAETHPTAFINAPPIFTEECPDCEGSGHWLDSVRWSGEAYGEQVERTCESCDGLGTVECEPKCDTCEGLGEWDEGAGKVRCRDCGDYGDETDLVRADFASRIVL